MKLAIVGSRTFNKRSLMIRILTQLNIKPRPELIISGGAKGADTLAKNYAEVVNVPFLEFLADWDKYGKSAGYKRNVQIVDACDKLVAFWDGHSKGTKHSIDLAEKAGKLLKVIIV